MSIYTVRALIRDLTQTAIFFRASETQAIVFSVQNKHKKDRLPKGRHFVRKLSSFLYIKMTLSKLESVIVGTCFEIKHISKANVMSDIVRQVSQCYFSLRQSDIKTYGFSDIIVAIKLATRI